MWVLEQDVAKGFLLMTLGGVLEPYTPSMNNTSFTVGARSLDKVFEGTVQPSLRKFPVEAVREKLL